MERAHVLVVDDEEDLRLVVRRLLESSGYRMTGAADAGRAAAIRSGDVRAKKSGLAAGFVGGSL